MVDEPATYRPFMELLPISGVSVSVFDQSGRQSTVWASNEVAARLDELQFELGEGPHWDAVRLGNPVLVPTLIGDELNTWPMLSAAIAELPVAALFSFPMFLGAVTVGVADLYRSIPGELDTADVATAIRLTRQVARATVQTALDHATDESGAELPSTPAMRREVHQATGMILVQLNISATEAFARLRAHAFVTGRSVQSVAHDVVSRTIDFRDLGD
jgi:hypothetical protein